MMAVDGTVQTQLFEYGHRDASGNHFYTLDHLGTLRDTVGGDGSRSLALDYDPFGRQSTAFATEQPLIGFTANWAYSGVTSFAPYRAYDANIGRWLSEDPIGFAGGYSLSAYVGNNPISRFDPLGLKCVSATAVQYIGLDSYKHHWPVGDNRPGNFNIVWFTAECDCCKQERPTGFRVSRSSTNPPLLDAIAAPWDVTNPEVLPESIEPVSPCKTRVGISWSSTSIALGGRKTANLMINLKLCYDCKK